MDIFNLELIAQITMVIVSITYVIVIVVTVKKHKKRIAGKDNIIRDLREENLQLIAKLRGYLIDLDSMTITLTEERPWRRIYLDLEDIFNDPIALESPPPMIHGIDYRIYPEWKIIINGRCYDWSSELENKVRQE